MSSPQQPPWGAPPPPGPYGQQPPPPYGQGGYGQAGYGQPRPGFGHSTFQQSYGGYRPASNQPGFGGSPYGSPAPGYGIGAPSPDGDPDRTVLRPGGQAWGPPLPAPRRRNPLAAILVTLLVVTGVAMAALIVVALATSNGGGGGEGRYVNQDYTPPPPDLSPSRLPQPQTVGEAEQLLEANALYDQTMPTPVRCDLRPIDLDAATDDEIEEHMSVLMGCLTGAWVGPVEAAGYEMPRPSVTVYSGTSPIKTACGELPDRNAVYCGADQQIYYANNLHQALPSLSESRYGAELVMAHEYGHAVQGRTGILTARTGLVNLAKTEAEAYELNRRFEAQADCFDGLFMRSASIALGIQQDDLTGFDDVFDELGGDDPGRTHPSGQSRVYWWTLGLSTDQIGQCNTFTAPASTVR